MEYREFRSLQKQLEKVIEDAKNGRDDEDYLRFQAEQLADACLQENEQIELEEEAKTLEHAEDIKGSLYQASCCLQSPDDGTDVLGMLKQGMSSIQSISKVYASADELAERLNSCYIELKDIADELEGKAEDVAYNPRRLEQIRERLNIIYSLQKKHSVDSVEELLSIQRDLEEKLLNLDKSEWYTI